MIFLLLIVAAADLLSSVLFLQCHSPNRSDDTSFLAIVNLLFIAQKAMFNPISKFILLAVVAVFSAEAFAPTTSHSRRMTSMMAVVDIDGEAAFDKTIKSAGSSLVIVDYSTTWCGPCKVIAPKFDELSEKYPDAVFLKV